MAEYGDDTVNLFACSMNHISPYLFLSREDADDNDVRDIRKRDFRSVLLQPMSYNAGRVEAHF